MERLKRRTDFRAAASGIRASANAFVLQARQRAVNGPVRVGFTVSRQVGNAVERNRVRRRLREIVRLAADDTGCDLRDGHDYVLIGRRAALVLPFGEMRRELDAALGRIHGSGQAQGTARNAEPAATGRGRQRSLHQAGSPRPRPTKPRGKPRNA